MQYTSNVLDTCKQITSLHIMTNPTASQHAAFIAPLGTYPSCRLYQTILVISKGGVERCLPVFTKDGSLYEAVQCRRRLAPGWSIEESLCAYEMEAT